MLVWCTRFQDFRLGATCERTEAQSAALSFVNEVRYMYTQTAFWESMGDYDGAMVVGQQAL
jgi:hypothetical protein